MAVNLSESVLKKASKEPMAKQLKNTLKRKQDKGEGAKLAAKSPYRVDTNRFTGDLFAKKTDGTMWENNGSTMSFSRGGNIHGGSGGSFPTGKNTKNKKAGK